METGELTSVIVYALQILSSLMMVSFVFVMIMIAEASTDRIAEVLDEVPEMQRQAGRGEGCQTELLILKMWTSAMQEKAEIFP